MKANELKKIPISLNEIYENIQRENANGHYKVFLEHFKVIEESTKLQLMQDGFKCYIGDWDGILTNCFIIEW